MAGCSAHGLSAARLAVVGHVEWLQFARVPHVPRQGEVVHARASWEEPAGGGAVAAVQLARLAGAATFLTALADDELGRACAQRLAREGVRVHAALRPPPQRRAFTFLDDAGERTITVLGERMVPSAGDDLLPWDELARADGVYFTGGDVAALQAARAARVLVATPRASATLLAAGVRVDALVGSAGDPREALDPALLEQAPACVIATEGARGGSWRSADGRTGRWRAAPLPGPPGDSYGCGDSFAAAVTFGLSSGWPLEAAIELGARCGAVCRAGAGPYGRPIGPQDAAGAAPAGAARG